jgi:hypothetical protein
MIKTTLVGLKNLFLNNKSAFFHLIYKTKKYIFRLFDIYASLSFTFFLPFVLNLKHFFPQNINFAVMRRI